MGEAANGKDAMDQIEKLQPQIVISDVVMPLMDGVDFTVAVHHRYPHIQMIILSGYDNFEYVKQTLMQGVVDYILKPTLTPHELLGVLQKAAARIPGWHPDHAMTGEPRRNCSKNCCSGKQKQEKNCKRYLPHPITACMRLRLRMGVNGRQKQQNFYAKKYSVPKMNFPEYSSVLFRRASSSLFCRKVLQTELWGLSKDKTTCQIPWVFRISVKLETHGFCI